MLEGAPGYVWRGLRDALEEGQSWVVITLVGMFTVSACRSVGGLPLMYQASPLE
jgi:hypothetical protein